jgi:hypothetical protein
LDRRAGPICTSDIPIPLTLHSDGSYALAKSDTAAPGRGLLREIIDLITVHPREAGEPCRFELHGRLATPMGLPRESLLSVGQMVPRGGIIRDHRQDRQGVFMLPMAA